MNEQGLRILIIHWIAKILGILIHINGMPFGSNRNLNRQSTFSTLDHSAR
ncbi:hypothetical protein FHW00_004985 [Ochrobactrum sp. P6BSIII]|nr:hypothetical protein [Ochrobactrum sp. P6BSIII]